MDDTPQTVMGSGSLAEQAVSPARRQAAWDEPVAVPLWSAIGPSAASLLGIGRTLAYAAADRGEIPTVKIGGRRLVPLAALHRMLDNAG